MTNHCKGLVAAGAKPRVYVEVVGGCVQVVAVNVDAQVLLVDYDNIEHGDTPHMGQSDPWTREMDAAFARYSKPTLEGSA